MIQSHKIAYFLHFQNKICCAFKQKSLLLCPVEFGINLKIVWFVLVLNKTMIYFRITLLTQYKSNSYPLYASLECVLDVFVGRVYSKHNIGGVSEWCREKKKENATILHAIVRGLFLRKQFPTIVLFCGAVLCVTRNSFFCNFSWASQSSFKFMEFPYQLLDFFDARIVSQGKRKILSNDFLKNIMVNNKV